MCIKFGKPVKKCTIHIWLDNAEVLTRITTKASDDVRLKSYGVRDYGDMVVMRNLNAMLPSMINMEYHKIKSHQSAKGFETFEEAACDKEAIQICKGNEKNWLLSKGITPESNAKLRREQVFQQLLKELSEDS